MHYIYFTAYRAEGSPDCDPVHVHHLRASQLLICLRRAWTLSCGSIWSCYRMPTVWPYALSIPRDGFWACAFPPLTSHPLAHAQGSSGDSVVTVPHRCWFPLLSLMFQHPWVLPFVRIYHPGGLGVGRLEQHFEIDCLALIRDQTFQMAHLAAEPCRGLSISDFYQSPYTSLGSGSMCLFLHYLYSSGQ